MSIKKLFKGDFANLFILLTLLSQVILLVALTQRITQLEELLFSASTPEIVNRIPEEQGHVLGPVNAPVTVVEFADFQCPYCASAELIIKQILSQHPDKIRFIYRHFPLIGIHPYAMQAANASECASNQNKFWEMHNQLYDKQDEFYKEDFSGQEFFLNIASEIGINNIQILKTALSTTIFKNISPETLVMG